MAYMSQERKATIKARLDNLLDKKMGWRYSLAVRNHSTLVLTLWAGPVDFIGNFRAPHNASFEEVVKSMNVVSPNEYHLDTQFSGDELEVMKLIKEAMMEGNHDNSDPMSDYYDVGWYIDINLGDHRGPYVYTQSKNGEA